MNLFIKKGSSENGYIAYYAKAVYNSFVCDGDWIYDNYKKTVVIGYVGNASSATIPEQVTGIGVCAFAASQKLESLVIPNPIQVSSDAFVGCELHKIIVLANSELSGLSTALTSAKDMIVYVANDKYSDGQFGKTLRKLDFLSSMFTVDGIRYVPLSPSERTCIAIDCEYSPTNETVKISETVNYKGVEMKVAEIGPYALISNSYINSIDIAASAAIPKQFASNCTHVSSITLNNNGIVDANAFEDCINLQDLYVGKSVTTIGAYAFKNAMSNVGNGQINLNNFGNISEYAFYGCKGLHTLVVNMTVRDIAEFAFSGAMSAPNIVDGSITLNNRGCIGRRAFYENTGLRTLTIGKYVTDIYNEAFSGSMTATTECTADINNTGAIGNGSFMNCTGLKSLLVGDNVTGIGNNAFNGAISSVDNGTITLNNKGDIGDSAFDSCTGLSIANLSNSTSSIGESAFSNCPGLTSFTIPNLVTSIGRSTFSDCSGLTSIIIPNSVTSIGESAFSGCVSLQIINLPSAITSIAPRTFYGCAGLKDIVLPSQLMAIEHLAFEKSGIETLRIPKSVKRIAIVAFEGCESLTSLYFEDGPDLLSINTSYANILSKSPLTEIYIGRLMDQNIFENHPTLKKVTISKTPTFINERMFYGYTALTDVSIGDGVTKIGNYAFSGCTALSSFTFGRNMKEIGDEAFSDCLALKELYAEPATPPVCGTQALDDINKWECVLYVRSDAVDKYRAAEQWKEFFFVNDFDYGVDEINLSATELTLQLGSTTTITAEVLPENTKDKTLTWISSDETVATISADGEISALGLGTATITASAANGVTATCVVTVRPVPAETITLNYTELSMELDGWATLVAFILPENTTDKTVVWSTSDETVVSVDERGNVKAIGVGTAIITAKCGKVSASCKITVEDLTDIKLALSSNDTVQVYDTNGKMVYSGLVRNMSLANKQTYIIVCNGKRIVKYLSK